MFGKHKSAPPKAYPLHEWLIKLDELIADGRAGSLDGRDLANVLDARANALRLSFVVHAPSDAAF
jgi:hypothetical protein